MLESPTVTVRELNIIFQVSSFKSSSCYVVFMVISLELCVHVTILQLDWLVIT